ncbi:SRPBCC family protein [Novosphingobium sp. 9U]|uniref:SRPBCC family protein n=1 Tax=Novosphingobium sp. 9U TaxID=2653158 RepID=UPI0012F0F039|nr:SRPBCC family protein [Novosphingobium sp. 9U]VWX46450.1 conserved exported hypothetical protein [Novosphingobium sp. 9U]
MRVFLTIVAAAMACAALPAQAEVHDSSSAGFAVRATATVPAAPEQVWDELLDPADWWNGTHTFSGDAANLSLDPRAGGCFCEILPSTTDKAAPPRGGVQHMQVVYLEKPRVLRMSGALGPLQSEPVVGSLTFVIKAENGQTRINAEYVVGGYMRIPSARMAPIVDKVIGDQLGRLAGKLGGALEQPTGLAKPALPEDPAALPRKPIIGR